MLFTTLAAAIAGTGITPYPPACGAQALNREGVALAREGKRTEALVKFQAARQAAPGLVPKASYNAAMLLEQAGKSQDALVAYLEARQGFLFEAALPDAPWLADAYYNLGLVSDFTGAHAKALEALRTYLALAPQSPQASAVKTKIVELEDKLGAAEMPRKP